MAQGFEATKIAVLTEGDQRFGVRIVSLAFIATHGRPNSKNFCNELEIETDTQMEI